MGNKKSKKKAEPDNGEEFGAQWKHGDAKKKADAEAKAAAAPETSTEGDYY